MTILLYITLALMCVVFVLVFRKSDSKPETSELEKRCAMTWTGGIKCPHCQQTGSPPTYVHTRSDRVILLCNTCHKSFDLVPAPTD